MTLKHLQEWAQAQIDNTAQPEVRPDIGVTVLQLIDEIEQLQNGVKELEEKTINSCVKNFWQLEIAAIQIKSVRCSGWGNGAMASHRPLLLKCNQSTVVP